MNCSYDPEDDRAFIQLVDEEPHHQVSVTEWLVHFEDRENRVLGLLVENASQHLPLKLLETAVRI